MRISDYTGAGWTRDRPERLREAPMAILSQTAEYALRAMAYLAQQPPGTSCDVGLLAGVIGVPRNYLSKILSQLARENLVTSTRGKGGGFALGRSPAAITIYEVVAPFDRLDRGARCLLGQAVCSERHPCPAHKGWRSVSDHLLRFLKRGTLEQLAAGLTRWPGLRRGAGAK